MNYENERIVILHIWLTHLSFIMIASQNHITAVFCDILLNSGVGRKKVWVADFHNLLVLRDDLLPKSLFNFLEAFFHVFEFDRFYCMAMID